LLLDLTVWLGKLFLERWYFLRLLLEDETAEASGALFWRQLIKETVEEQLAKHELITSANFASNTGLELNNVGIVNEAESSQHTFPTLQLV
jgi:hypothetical protein